MLISGGGTEIRVWSMLSRGQLVTRLDNFVKTVTALHLYQPVNPSAGTAGLAVSLLTGSLDGNLRVRTRSSVSETLVSKAYSFQKPTVLSINAVLSPKSRLWGLNGLHACMTYVKYLSVNLFIRAKGEF